jgi:hypothetical protein
MKFKIVFWDLLPCKIIVDRRFRGTYCLPPLIPDDGGSTSASLLRLFHCYVETFFYCKDEAFVFIVALMREYNNDAPFNCCVTVEP